MKRELNDLEYFQWIMGQPYNMVMAVRLKGKLPPDRLRKVLDKVQQRHPLLQVTTIIDEQSKPWFISEGVGKIPLNIIDREGDEHALHVIEQEFAFKFSMDSPQKTALPLIRVTLLAGTAPANDLNDIIFCTQHTIADGMSMVFLIRDLIQFMGNPDKSIIVLDATTSKDDLFPPKIRKKIPKTEIKFNILFEFLKGYHLLKFGKPQKSHLIRDQKPVLNPLETSPPKQSFKLHSWSLTEDQTKRFLVRCKEERVSVHAALCTAFLSNFPVINSPVNFRNRLAHPVGDSFGLFTGGVIIKMRYNSSMGFWKNTKKFHRKLLTQLRDSKVFSIYSIFSKAVPRAKIQKMGPIYADVIGYRLPFTITNLGSLDNINIPLETEDLRIKEFFGGVAGIGIVLLVYTINKAMHFHIQYMEPNTIDATARSWAQDAMNLLEIAYLHDR